MISEVELLVRARDPNIFTRSFSVPAGLPWEQTRAAQLDARHGAPLPIEDAMSQIRRLDRWMPGRSGRFAAMYIRTRDFVGPFEANVEVDGSIVRVAFGATRRTGPTWSPHFRNGNLIAWLAASGTLATVSVGVSLSLAARSEIGAELDQLEQLLARQAVATDRLHRERDLVQALSVAPGAGHRADQALADLAWASAGRSPDGRIVAVHWDHGLLAVETRGEATPFASSRRAVQRADRPVRPGVWLWAVSPEGDVRSGFLR